MTHQVDIRVPSAVYAVDRANDAQYLRWRVDELQASQRRQAALTERSTEITGLVAPNGTILNQDLRMVHILGYSPSEMVGRSLFAYMHREDAELASNAWNLILQSPLRGLPLSVRLKHKDGSWRWLSGTATNRLTEPDIQAIVLNLQDVTESHRNAERVDSLNQELNRQARDMRDLNTALRSLVEADSLDGLHAALDARLRALLGVDAVVVLRTAPDGGLRCVFSAPSAGHGPAVPPSLASATVDAVFAGAQPAVEGDLEVARRPDELVQWLTGLPARAMLAAPLMRKGAVDGAVIGAFASPCALTAHHAYVMSALAGAVAITAENLQLLESEREQRRLSEIQQDIVSTLARSVDGGIDQVRERMLDVLHELVQADAGCILRVQEDSLCPVGWHGFAGSASNAGLLLPLEDCRALAALVATGGPVCTPDIQADADWSLPEPLGCYRAYMAVAVRAGDDTLGVMLVASGAVDHFRDEHAWRLMSLADQVAVGLRNADLISQLRASAERANKLSRILVKVLEAERQRIARDLHDEAGQALTVILGQLRRLEAPGLPAADRAGCIGETRGLVHKVMDSLRTVAVQLRPPALDHASLAECVRDYVHTFCRQQGIQAHFETNGLGDERFSSETETTIYRVVQESLSNIAKHACATRVHVMLNWQPSAEAGVLRAVVEDDGCGFDVEAARQSGRLGLGGIAERVEWLGGRLTIESEPGHGSALIIALPCSPLMAVPAG